MQFYATKGSNKSFSKKNLNQSCLIYSLLSMLLLLLLLLLLMLLWLFTMKCQTIITWIYIAPISTVCLLCCCCCCGCSTCCARTRIHCSRVSRIWWPGSRPSNLKTYEVRSKRISDQMKNLITVQQHS